MDGLFCHRRRHDSDDSSSEESQILRPRKSPRPESVIAKTIKQLQSNGGFAWEEPQSRHRPRRPRPASRAPSCHDSRTQAGTARCSPGRGDTRTPAAVSRQRRGNADKGPRQQNDETQPIWEDVDCIVAASLAKELDRGVSVTKIPKEFRLSFSDENMPADANVFHGNPDRQGAMKMATQQAAIREEAARAVLCNSPRSHSEFSKPLAMFEEAARAALHGPSPPPRSHLPAPPPVPAWASNPQSPRCLTFLPAPPPPPKHVRSPRARSPPRCMTMAPLESPQPQRSVLHSERSPSVMSQRKSKDNQSSRCDSRSQARAQSLSRVRSATCARSQSRSHCRSPGPPRSLFSDLYAEIRDQRSNSRAPCSPRGLSGEQSHWQLPRSTSRSGLLSPGPSFLAGLPGPP